jgi:hypothetical protein
MTGTAQILFQWDGEAMHPVRGFEKRADQAFVVGERYRMEVIAAHSWQSHKHQFAWIAEAWRSLPEALSVQYPSPEHLRKFALIAKGHCTVQQHVCQSKAEALRMAAALKPMDEFAVIITRDTVVSVYRAMSQSIKAMGGAQFQKSKTDVLDYVANLLGCEPDDLGQAA